MALYPNVGDCYKSDTTQYYIKVLETKDKIIKFQQINMFKTETMINVEISEVYRLFLDRGSTISFVYPLICELMHKIFSEEYNIMYNKINKLIIKMIKITVKTTKKASLDLLNRINTYLFEQEYDELSTAKQTDIKKIKDAAKALANIIKS